jgi:hypothetical protein
MLDYYGSINYPLNNIKEDIYSHFKEYSNSFLDDIIDELIKEDILKKEYSISGWNVFHRNHIISEIQENIKKRKQLSLSYIRLLLIKLIKNEIINEEGLIHIIYNYINSQMAVNSIFFSTIEN